MFNTDLNFVLSHLSSKMFYQGSNEFSSNKKRQISMFISKDETRMHPVCWSPPPPASQPSQKLQIYHDYS